MVDQNKTLTAAIHYVKTGDTGALKELQRDTDAAAKSGKALNLTEQELAVVAKAAQQRIGELKTQLQALNAVKQGGSVQAKALQTQIDALAGSASRTGQSLAGMSTSVSLVANQFGSLGQVVSTIFSPAGAVVGGVALGTAALAAFTREAFNANQALNKSLANIGTVLPGQPGRLQQLRGGIQNISSNLGLDSGNVAGGVYESLSAFGDRPDTLKLVEMNAKAAAAGLTDVNQTLKLSVAYMKTFGDTSAEANQHMLDLAFSAVRIGQITFPELAAAFPQVAARAAELGISIEELMAIFATFSGVSGATGAEVGTQLSALFTVLEKNSEDASASLKNAGIESGRFKDAIAERGLMGTIRLLGDSANDLGKELIDLTGRKEAAILVTTALADAGRAYDDNLKEMIADTGAAERAFGEISDGADKLGFKINQLHEAQNRLKESWGEATAPMMLDIVVTTTNIVKDLSAHGATPETDALREKFLRGQAGIVRTTLSRSNIASYIANGEWQDTDVGTVGRQAQSDFENFYRSNRITVGGAGSSMEPTQADLLSARGSRIVQAEKSSGGSSGTAALNLRIGSNKYVSVGGVVYDANTAKATGLSVAQAQALEGVVPVAISASDLGLLQTANPASGGGAGRYRASDQEVRLAKALGLRVPTSDADRRALYANAQTGASNAGMSLQSYIQTVFFNQGANKSEVQGTGKFVTATDMLNYLTPTNQIDSRVFANAVSANSSESLPGNAWTNSFIEDNAGYTTHDRRSQGIGWKGLQFDLQGHRVGREERIQRLMRPDSEGGNAGDRAVGRHMANRDALQQAGANIAAAAVEGGWRGAGTAAIQEGLALVAAANPELAIPLAIVGAFAPGLFKEHQRKPTEVLNMRMVNTDDITGPIAGAIQVMNRLLAGTIAGGGRQSLDNRLDLQTQGFFSVGRN